MFKHIKTCQWCGEDFGTNWPGAKYCCQAHRQAAYVKRHAVEVKGEYCRWCGGKFWPDRGDAKYCKPAHKQAAYRARIGAGRQGMF